MYSISWQLVQQMLSYFSLDQSKNNMNSSTWAAVLICFLTKSSQQEASTLFNGTLCSSSLRPEGLFPPALELSSSVSVQAAFFSFSN